MTYRAEQQGSIDRDKSEQGDLGAHLEQRPKCGGRVIEKVRGVIRCDERNDQCEDDSKQADHLTFSGKSAVDSATPLATASSSNLGCRHSGMKLRRFHECTVVTGAGSCRATLVTPPS